jgi:hypothetical protein
MRLNLRVLWGLLAAVAVVAPSAVQAQAQTVSVGPGAGCTSTTLAGALVTLPRLGPGVVHRVRVMSDTMITGGATLDRISARIEGGYASCTATAPQPLGLSRIGGPANGPLLRLRNVTEAANTFQVEVVGFEFRDGTDAAIEVDGRVNLRLERVELVNNRAAQGGGLRVIGRRAGWTQGAVVNFGPGVIINANEARAGDGGGLHCSAGGVLNVAADAGPFVINNVASGRGGGIFLSQCALVLLAPQVAGSATQPIYVSANIAGTGGGVAMVDAEWVGNATPGHAGIEISLNTTTGRGDGGGVWMERSVLSTASPLRVTDNTAGGYGGGVFLRSSQLDLLGTELTIGSNRAVIGGGGLHAEGTAQSTTRDAGACGGPCVRIEDNVVTSTAINEGAGGGLFLRDQATLGWDRVLIRSNRAYLAPALYAVGSPPSAPRIEWWNTAVIGNVGTYVFGFEGAPIVFGSGGVRFELGLSTIAANVASSTGSAVPQVIRLFSGSSVALRGVVIEQPAWVSVGSPQSVQTTMTGACVYSREVASLQLRGVPAVAADPRVRVDAGGVRLEANSPVIDACTAADVGNATGILGLSPLAHDLTGRSRPVRLISFNPAFAYDAGADEYVVRVFASGFEDAN